MKKITFYLFAFFSFTFAWQGNAQVLNQNAGWPNAMWSVTGTYNADPTAFEYDPTTTSNFAFDDDDAGDGNLDDIAAESPVIDLTAAHTAGETWLTVGGDFVYNWLNTNEILSIEYYDADATSWMTWYDFPGVDTSGAPLDDFCSGTAEAWSSTVLNIVGFTPTQLSGFKYRIFFDDDVSGSGGWQWGFCFQSPTIVSETPPSCPDPSSLNISMMMGSTAELGWSENGSSGNWDIEWGATGFSATGTPTINDTSNNPETLTGLVSGNAYDCYVRSDCGMDDTTNVSNWTGPYTFTFYPIPDCATTPFPADGATNVPVGDLTFTWVAPASGPTPTSYNIYAYDDAAGTNPFFIGNFATESADLTINAFSTTIFWAPIPVNGSTEATGCAVWEFTTEAFPGYCLLAPSGQYPGTDFTPSTCDGSTPNEITAFAWAGEYSTVNVTSGYTYVFSSSVSDLLTVSNDTGSTMLVYGVSSVSYDADFTGIVRIYRNLDDGACGSENVSRSISVVCGPTLGIDDLNSDNLFTYYPNPVYNVLTLKASNYIDSVTIYNMLGQQVMSISPNMMTSEVDMSNFSKGSYFVQVTVEGTSDTVRIIKE